MTPTSIAVRAARETLYATQDALADAYRDLMYAEGEVERHRAEVRKKAARVTDAARRLSLARVMDDAERAVATLPAGASEIA